MFLKDLAQADHPHNGPGYVYDEDDRRQLESIIDDAVEDALKGTAERRTYWAQFASAALVGVDSPDEPAIAEIADDMLKEFDARCRSRFGA